MINLFTICWQIMHNRLWKHRTLVCTRLANMWLSAVVGWPERGLRSMRGSPSICFVMEAGVRPSEPVNLLLCEHWCLNARSQVPTHSSLVLKERKKTLPIRGIEQELKNLNSAKSLYLVVNQMIVWLWLGLGCLIFHLLLGLDHSGTPQVKALGTPTQLSVNRTTKDHFSVSSSSAVLYQRFVFSPNWLLTLFCKLSSCSLYHLSFSSRLFFSSSSFFTKSISLERKQGNMISQQSLMCLLLNYLLSMFKNPHFK